MDVPPGVDPWTLPDSRQLLEQIVEQFKAFEPWKDEEEHRREATARFESTLKQRRENPGPNIKPMSPMLSKLGAEPAWAKMQKDVAIMYESRYGPAARGPATLDDVMKTDPAPSPVHAGAAFKEEGAALFKLGKLAEAREVYAKAIKHLLQMKDKDEIPGPSAYVKAVLNKDPYTFWLALACASNAAQCAIKEKRITLVRANAYLHISWSLQKSFRIGFRLAAGSPRNVRDIRYSEDPGVR